MVLANSNFQSRRAKRIGTKRIKTMGNGNEIGILHYNNTIRTMDKAKCQTMRMSGSKQNCETGEHELSRKKLSLSVSISPSKAITEADTFTTMCHRSLLRICFCLYSCSAFVLFLFRLLFWFLFFMQMSALFGTLFC